MGLPMSYGPGYSGGIYIPRIAHALGVRATRDEASRVRPGSIGSSASIFANVATTLGKKNAQLEQLKRKAEQAQAAKAIEDSKAAQSAALASASLAQSAPMDASDTSNSNNNNTNTNAKQQRQAEKQQMLDSIIAGTRAEEMRSLNRQITNVRQEGNRFTIAKRLADDMKVAFGQDNVHADSTAFSDQKRARRGDTAKTLPRLGGKFAKLQ
jgi:hypothetical protein